jgi:hypothetical protein
MWPPVTQFETLDLRAADQLERRRIRKAAAARAGAKPIWRRLRLGRWLQPPGSAPRSAGARSG